MARLSGGEEGSFLERQQDLLQSMLQATRDQRRCLIEGDLGGVEQSNRLLGVLLQSQHELQAEGPDPAETAAHHALERVRELARQLQRESRTNYLLACRGAEFTRFSLSLLTDSVSGKGSGRSRLRSPVLDRPA